MTLIRSGTISINVTQPGVLPAWLKPSGTPVPLYQWSNVPNSIRNSNNPFNINDQYFPDKLGLARPSLNNSVIDFGRNKYGIQSLYCVRGLRWTGNHNVFNGIAFDPQGSRVLMGGGEAHWSETSFQRLNYNVDTPYWESYVVESELPANFRFNCPQGTDESHADPSGAFPFDGSAVGGTTTYVNSATGQSFSQDPLDINGEFRTYRGRHWGGHNYWTQWYIRQRGWLIQFEQHQRYPDQGYSTEAHVCTVPAASALPTAPYHPTPGSWIIDPVGGPYTVPRYTFSGPDYRQWKQKHYTTEDIYQLGGSVVMVWRQATNSYQTIYNFPNAAQIWARNYSLVFVSGGLDWEHNYLLFEGRSGSNPNDPTSRRRFMIDLTVFETGQLGTYSDVTFTGSQVNAIDGASVSGHAFAPMVWNPDLQAFVFWNDANGEAYTVTRTGATTFACELLATTGAAKPVPSEVFNTKQSGILSGFVYDPNLKGMLLYLGDPKPFKFFRTG